MDLTGALLLVVSASAFAWLWAHDEPLTTTISQGLHMKLTATWTDANGVTHTVTTTQGPDEPYDAFQGRHDAAVAAMLLKYPPAVGD